MNAQEIGLYIKQRRVALEVKQRELAALAGVGINTLVAVERGEGNPRLDTLLAILDTLGLQADVRLKD